MRKKEEWVVKFLKKSNIIFDREINISYKNCGENDTWAWLDFVIYKEDHIIILSVDEFQHYDYEVECEVSRMSKVITAIRQNNDMRSILWIRFNPDYFSVDGEKQKINITNREMILLNCIKNSRILLNNKQLVIQYLFYNTVEIENKMIVETTLNPTYNTLWKDLVNESIVK